MKKQRYISMIQAGIAALVVVGIFIGIANVLGDGETRSSSPAQKAIDQGVYTPYTKNAFPQIFATWGEDGVKKINNLRILAASKAASSSECPKVEISELSNNRSRPPKEIVIFVDCSNQKRFFFAERELVVP